MYTEVLQWACSNFSAVEYDHWYQYSVPLPHHQQKSMRNAIQRLALLPIVTFFLLPAACYQIQLRVSLEKCPLPAHPLRLYKPIQLCRLQKEWTIENKPHRVPLPLPIPQRHRMGRFTNTIIVQLYDFKRQGWAIAPVWLSMNEG